MIYSWFKRELNEIREYCNKEGFGQGFLVGLMVFVLGDMVVEGIRRYDGRIIPNPSAIQQGYAIPAKLRVRVRDLDRDGKGQTILHYDSLDYLLKLEENRPVLVQCERGVVGKE